MTTYESVSLEVSDGIARLTLIRPELLNRVDGVMHRELPQVLAELRDLPGVRAAILASTGRVFSAGGDFELTRAVHDDREVQWREIDYGRQIVERLIDLPVPVVAAVHGHVMGVGATIVLGCDVVVASRGVKIADPHVLVGLCAGDGGALFWPLHTGMLRAKRYLLTGESVLAEDALGMGLITDLVETPADVLPAAEALAHLIASRPPIAVQGTKRILNTILRQRSSEVLDASFSMMGHSHTTDDVLEAIDAFKEKREGHFQGR